MPTWICVFEGINVDISVPIERFQILGTGHNRVCGDGPSQPGSIPADVVAAQPLSARQGEPLILSGETFGGQRAEGPTPVATNGILIRAPGSLKPPGICGEQVSTQVVRVQLGEDSALTDGDDLAEYPRH